MKKSTMIAAIASVIFYHDEDEMDGNSGRYMVECVFHNQEFNIE